MIDTASIVLRAASFIALFQAAGIAIFLALFQAQLAQATMLSLRRTGLWSALAALVLVTGHFLFEPARMGGDLAAMKDPALRAFVLQSPLATAFVWRAGGLSVLIAGLAWASPAGRAIALLGALALLIAFAQVGHTANSSSRVLLASILLVHISIVAFWFGALPPLRRIALRESPQSAARVIETFSSIAIVLVPLLAVAGVALAVVLLGQWSNLRTPYGRIIVLKVMLFAGLMLLAALNRRRYVPALAAGTPRAARDFSRSVVAEYILIAAALASTAALTTLYSPDS
jgi:putative copper resistance protein D